VADVTRTCTNCGNAQATGDFCEKCGTRLPAAGAAATAQDATAKGATQPGGDPQASPAQPGPAPSEQAAEPQLSGPKVPSWLPRVFDLSFEGFVTRGSIKVLYIASMVLVGIYFLLSFIFFVVMAARWDPAWCIGIFVNILVVIPLAIGWTRVMLELTMTVSKLREDLEKPATKRPSKAASKTKS
jgi:hypothetical protein